MKLYGAIASAYSVRAILVARAKGIELPQAMPKGDGLAALKLPEYLALNPLGRIPTLETAEGCIIESLAICEYIDEAGSGPKLMPADPFARARTRMLTLVLDGYAMPPWRAAMLPNFHPARRDTSQVEAGVASIRAGLKHLEILLGEGPYALGAAFSFADCMLYPLIAHLSNTGREFFGVSDLLRDTPKLAGWLAHLDRHPVAGPCGKEQFERFSAFARAVWLR